MRIKLIAAVVASALIATGCGGGSDAPDDGGATTGTETEASGGDEGDGGGEVALRWRTRPDNQAEADVYASVSETIDAANDGLALEYEPGGSETSSYQDVLKTEIAAGTAPDVFWIPGTDIADFAKRGLILDLREIADASEDYAGDDAYYPGPMEFLTYDPEAGSAGGSLWGLPRDVSTFALYLNLDLIEEAGAEDPRELAAAGEWDWEAFREVGEKVSALDAQIKGYGMNSWWANYGYWINAAGGNFFNEDRTACALDSDASIAGLEFMQGLYADDLAVPYGEDAEPPFLAGQVGMFMNGRWATPGTRTSAGFDWDVVKLPDGPGGPSNWLFWGAYVVNANTENPEAAFELLTELTSPETQATISELGANIPSRVDDASAQEKFLSYSPPANNQAFLDGLGENPVSEGPLWEGDWPAFDGAMGPEIQAVLAGDQTLDEFKASVCSKLDPTFG